ncbi:MAG: chorismate-binding protein [Bacteroidales bacterium]|nr:chorismate-binding protein [Bacteroidales bacterium]
MRTGNLKSIHTRCLANNLPFATWRLPDQSQIETIIATNTQEHHLPDFNTLEGFVVAPFEFNTHQRLWVLPAFHHFLNDDFDIGELKNIYEIPFREEKEIKATPYESYKTHFNHFQKLFSHNILQKAVLSRIKTTRTINRNLAPAFFEALRQNYPHAMVYMFNIPEKGLWIGATPETLIRKESQVFLTESIAATRSSGATSMAWTEKEITEQEMVTDYIRDILEKNQIKTYRMDGPTDHLAGNVEHLKTDFEIPYENLIPRLTEFITDMHPTPAICGLPKIKAYNEIINTESHNREFYSGFLGPVGFKDKMQLFVNLRCMQVFENYAALYAGGGLTSGSHPESEWQETEQKAETLLNIAENL